MYLRLALFATLATLLVQGAVARPETTNDVDFWDTNDVELEKSEDLATRIVETKDIPKDVVTRQDEVKQLIATQGFFISLLKEGWDLIINLIWAPFYWFIKVLDFIVLIPRLAIEGFMQWNARRKLSA